MRGDQERKQKILELYSAGQKQADIACWFEITLQTVNGIIKKAEQEKRAAQAGTAG
jgi:DNA invertase Pin-like site-specific DNA recombinase